MRLRSIPLMLACCVVCQTAIGGPVTDWHTFKNPATTLSGQGTANPVLGSAALPSGASFMVGYFDAMSLTNLGDRITFSFQVSFTDADGIANAQDNFRFALFDLNGQTPVVTENVGTPGVDNQTDDWRGYWFGVRHVSGVGSMRERIAALATGDNIFAAAGANNATVPTLAPGAQFGGVTGDPVVFVSSAEPQGGPVYTGVMALEKTPTGVALAGCFGGNGATNLFVANDDAAPFPVNYSAVAYLNGNPLNCDQLNFQNVTVDYSISNALQITSQPEDVSVGAGLSARFSVSWAGSGLHPTFQWRENGVDLLDATNSTYTIAAVSSEQDGYEYSVVIQNVFGASVISSNATLDVVIDNVPPTVLSASSLVSNVINVVFSEPVDPLTATEGSSYSLAGNSIGERTLVTSNIVALLLDNPISSTNYVLSIQNVQDFSGNPVVATNVPGFTHGFQGMAKVNISEDGVGIAFAVEEEIKVYATGNDIFNTQDQFAYVFNTYSGDFDLAVRIESLLNTDPNAKAGLMARVNTADLIFPDSRNVMITATPGRFIFQHRTNEISTSTAVATPRPPTDFPNCWVRLKRTGSVISGYTSINLNNEWTFISSLDTAESTDGPYPAEILVGLAVTGHNLNVPTEAVFIGFGTFVERPILNISRDGNNVELEWPTSSIGFLLQSASSLTMPIEWSNVSGSDSTNRVSVSLGNDPVYFRLHK